MGCSTSNILLFDTVVTTVEFENAMKEFELLNMTDEDIRRLYNVYINIVSVGRNTITLEVLLEYVGTVPSLFTERVFSIFSANEGEIDFRAFVLNVWNCCTFSKRSIEFFLFDLYDKNGSGFLPADEISIMLSEIHCISQNESDLYVRRELFDDQEAEFTKEKFHKFMATRQALLGRAFYMQRMFQNKLGGEKFWVKQTARRDARSLNSHYVSIAHLLYATHRGMHSLSHVTRPPVRIVASHVSAATDSVKGNKYNKVHAGANTPNSIHSTSTHTSSTHTIGTSVDTTTVYRKPFRPLALQPTAHRRKTSIVWWN